MPGWYHQINFDVLDMANSKTCIAGQLYGNFWDKFYGVWEFKKDRKDRMSKLKAQSYGLAVINDDVNHSLFHYDILAGLWVMKVNQLKHQN